MDNQALSNALGVQVQSPEAHGGPGGTATDSSRRNSRPPSKKPGSSGRSTRGGGKNSAAKDLKDPELYEALMKECVQEEALMAEANHQGRKKTKIYKAPSFVTQYLARNDVRPMKKPSAKFPRAQYYCRLCDYHCDTLTICISHIKDTRHTRLSKKQDFETTLYHLPKPNKHHLDHLNCLLRDVETHFVLSPQDVEVRERVATVISDKVSVAVPGCFVRLYGSSYSGFGLKDSLLNLDLIFPEEMKPHMALLEVLNMVSKTEGFSRVDKDFSSKIPKLFFTYDGQFACELTLNNHAAFQTSALLRDYARLDPRARTLGGAVRHWARLCKLDRQNEGTLPAHSFALLVVFFLQQETKPVLPCIHDYFENRELDTYESPQEKLASWKTRNTSTPAELLIEFFEFYALGFRSVDYVVSIRNVGGFTKAEKMWRWKKLMMEDPFSFKRPLTRSVNNVSVLDFIADCFKIAYLYFGTIQTKIGPVVCSIIVPDRSPARKAIKSQNADGSSNNDDEDPEDIDDDDASSLDATSANNPGAPAGNVQDLFAKLAIDSKSVLSSSSLTTAAPGNQTMPETAMTLEMLEESFKDDEDSEDEGDDGTAKTFEAFIQKHGRELTPKQARKVTELVPKNMIQFKFDGDILTMGQSPAQFCTVCSMEGHLQTNCPDETLPPPCPLYPLNPTYKEQLVQVCYNVMRRCMPSQEELRDRDYVLKELTKFVQKFFPKARLTVFGSSTNGFAFARSDLDISLTFVDDATGADLDSIQIIEQLSERLKQMKGLKNVEAITSAKVPIIKFTHFSTRIEADISLYNTLAQENTAMLRLYSAIDERVKVLGYMVKLFAKECDIGDASRGSLSSYAYILMLIYYLQQCDPPVVPVLQELHYPGKTTGVNEIDGWNAWYFSDAAALPSVWPGLGANRSSVFDLWLGFLSFYAHDFDDKNLVVSIRQKKPLSKFEKMWNCICVAIEDPFDLGHNLGAAISRKMNIFIKTSFLRTRERYGIPPSETGLRFYRTLHDYLWDVNHLTDGPPPNDRGCRACGKIGHLVRDCPRKKYSDDKKKAFKTEKQTARQRTISERASAQQQLLQKQHEQRQQLQQQQQQQQQLPPQKKDPDTTATELHNQAAPPSGGGPDYVQGLRGQQPQQSARNVQDAIQRLLLQHGDAGSGLGMGQGLNFPPPGNPGLPPNLGLGVLGAEPEVVGRKPDMNSAMTVEDLERSFSSEHAQGKNMSEGLEKQQVLSRDVEDSKRAGLGDLRQAAPPGFKAQGPPSVPFPASLQPERPQPGGVQPNLIGMPGLGLFNLNPAQQQQLLHSTLQHQAHLSQLHQPSTAAAADLPMPIPQAFMTSPFGMPLLGTAIQKPTPPMEMPEAIGTKSGGEPSRGLGCLGLTGLGLSPQKSSPMGLGPALTTANLMGSGGESPATPPHQDSLPLGALIGGGNHFPPSNIGPPRIPSASLDHPNPMPPAPSPLQHFLPLSPPSALGALGQQPLPPMLTGQLGAFLDHPGLARAGPQGLIPMMPHMGLPTSAAAMSVEELERQMMGSEPERKTKGDEEKKN